MKNKFYVPSQKFNRMAVVSLNEGVANVSFPGGDFRRVSVSVPNVPKEDIMTPNCYDLSESDRDYIASLTGNYVHDRENADVFGLQVVDSLEQKGLRTLIDMLRFDIEDQEDCEMARKWLRENFKTFQPYAESIIGKKALKKLLKAIDKAKEGGDNKDLNPKTILGLDRPEPNESDWKPSKASFVEHRAPEGNHRIDDGTMPEDKDLSRWKQDPDTGAWSSTGFQIPYLRKMVTTIKKDEFGETEVVSWEVVVIKDYKGEDLKVLNINYCPGEVPTLKFANLVMKANKEEQDYKQKVIAVRLLQKFRQCMTDRDPEIKTCTNGKVPVYFKSFLVEGKPVCVFSPIPYGDRTEEYKAKQKEFQERRKLWSDDTLVQ